MTSQRTGGDKGKKRKKTFEPIRSKEGDRDKGSIKKNLWYASGIVTSIQKSVDQVIGYISYIVNQGIC